MLVESSQETASSSTGMLKDVSPISTSKVTQSQLVKEAATSEMASDLNVEQPKLMKQSRSVHFSTVSIASVNQVTSLESTSAAPVKEQVCEETSTIIPKMSAARVGDQLMPQLEVEEMKKTETKSDRGFDNIAHRTFELGNWLPASY